MLAIKLRRIGKKNQATFRLVVAEKRSKLQGKFVDDLGWADPHQDTFKVNKERAEHWIQSGAQPTASAHNVLVRAGVINAPKIPVHAKPKKKEEGEESPKPEVAQKKEGTAPPISEPETGPGKEAEKEGGENKKGEGEKGNQDATKKE